MFVTMIGFWISDSSVLMQKLVFGLRMAVYFKQSSLVKELLVDIKSIKDSFNSIIFG